MTDQSQTTNLDHLVEANKMVRQTTGTALPPVRQWLRDQDDDATPPCPDCGCLLGIRLAMFTASGRDVWLCDTCDKEIDV